MFIPMLCLFVFGIGLTAFSSTKIKTNKSYTITLLTGLCLIVIGIYLALPI